MLVCVSLHNFAHETAGAARTRHSLLPFLRGRTFVQNFGRMAPRDREAVFNAKLSTSSRPICAIAHQEPGPIRRGLAVRRWCETSLATIDYRGYGSRPSPG